MGFTGRRVAGLIKHSGSQPPSQPLTGALIPGNLHADALIICSNLASWMDLILHREFMGALGSIEQGYRGPVHSDVVGRRANP